MFPLVFISCSDSYSDNDNDFFQNTKLKLIASKIEIEPFDDMKISIDVDNQILTENYDSIIWKTDGTAYSSFGKIWLNDDGRDLRVTNYKIGKFKVYALGYKDGVVFSTDSVEYEVKKPTGDFISIKWNVNKYNQYLHFTTGQTPPKYTQNNNWSLIFGGVSLILSNIVEDSENEYATLEIWPWGSFGRATNVPDIDDFDWLKYIAFGDFDNEAYKDRAAFEYKFLHAYLTDLYGASNYIYEGKDPSKTDLVEEYNQRFANVSRSNFYPCEIWDTPKSHISLLVSYSQSIEGPARGICSVIAEPRK